MRLLGLRRSGAIRSGFVTVAEAAITAGLMLSAIGMLLIPHIFGTQLLRPDDGPLAVSLARGLDNAIAQVDSLLTSASNDLTGTDGGNLAKLTSNKLLTQVALLPQCLFFEVLDAAGNTVASVPPMTGPENWRTRDYFEELSRYPRKGLFIGKPFSTKSRKYAGISLSRSIVSSDGSFAGAVVYGLNLASVRNLFADLGLDGSSSIILLSSDGTVLMRLPTDANMVGHVVEATDPLVKALHDGTPTVFADDPIDHIRRTFTLRRVGDRPLFIAIGRRPENGIVGWQANFLPVLLATLLMLLAIGLTFRFNHQRRSREQAEQERARRSQLFATMSHELRAPLHGIIGYAEQMHDEEHLSSEQARRLDTIIHAGRHLRDVINRLLDYWRLEARGPALKMQMVDMPAVLEECCALFEPEALIRSIELNHHVRAEAPRQFVTDPTSLREIVVNLLSNAVKFTTNWPRHFSRRSSAVVS
jgi:signal transduction histidine kinase